MWWGWAEVPSGARSQHPQSSHSGTRILPMPAQCPEKTERRPCPQCSRRAAGETGQHTKSAMRQWPSHREGDPKRAGDGTGQEHLVLWFGRHKWPDEGWGCSKKGTPSPDESGSLRGGSNYLCLGSYPGLNCPPPNS